MGGTGRAGDHGTSANAWVSPICCWFCLVLRGRSAIVLFFHYIVTIYGKVMCFCVSGLDPQKPVVRTTNSKRLPSTMSEDPDPELLESLLSQFTNHNSGKRSRVVALGREKRARTSRKPPAAACGPQPLPGPDGPWQVELPASPTLFSSSARTGSTARRGDAGDPFLGIPVDDFLEVSLDAATLQGGSPISQYLQDDDFSDRDSQTAGSPSGWFFRDFAADARLTPRVVGGSGSACRSTSGSLSQPASPLMPVPEGFGDPIYLVSLDPAQPGQTGFLMFPQVDSGSGLSMPLHLPLSGFSPVQGPNVLPASCAKQPLEAEPALIQLPDGPVIQAVAIPAGAALPLTASVAAREPTPIVPSVVPAPVASTAPPAHVIEPPSTKRKRGRPRKSVQEPAVAPQPGLHAVQSPSNVPNPPTGILLNNGQPAFGEGELWSGMGLFSIDSLDFVSSFPANLHDSTGTCHRTVFARRSPTTIPGEQSHSKLAD